MKWFSVCDECGSINSIVNKNVVIELLKDGDVFVLNERIMGDESYFMENYPFWNKILNYAMTNNTGIKHISYSEDHKNLKSGDHLLYLGENAKKQVDYLLKLKYDIISQDISQL